MLELNAKQEFMSLILTQTIVSAIAAVPTAEQKAVAIIACHSITVEYIDAQYYLNSLRSL